MSEPIVPLNPFGNPYANKLRRRFALGRMGHDALRDLGSALACERRDTAGRLRAGIVSVSKERGADGWTRDELLEQILTLFEAEAKWEDSLR